MIATTINFHHFKSVAIIISSHHYLCSAVDSELCVAITAAWLALFQGKPWTRPHGGVKNNQEQGRWPDSKRKGAWQDSKRNGAWKWAWPDSKEKWAWPDST